MAKNLIMLKDQKYSEQLRKAWVHRRNSRIHFEGKTYLVPFEMIEAWLWGLEWNEPIPEKLVPLFGSQ